MVVMAPACRRPILLVQMPIPPLGAVPTLGE